MTLEKSKLIWFSKEMKVPIVKKRRMTIKVI